VPYEAPVPGPYAGMSEATAAGSGRHQVQSAKTSIVAGIVLMAIGLLWLLDVLGVLNSATFLPPLVFAGVGLVFVTLFARRQEFWWAAIPGSVFLGLAAVITATQTGGGDQSAAYLFLFMAAGFAAVYLRIRAFWWALIPCGVMLTLAVVVALPPQLQGMTVAAVFFLGLAATFGALSLVPAQHDPGGPADRTARMRWPLIPAAVLGVLGVVFALQATAVLMAADVVLPAVMILAGIGLLVYAYRARHHRQHGPHGA
jgi:hypothetical protein